MNTILGMRDTKLKPSFKWNLMHTYKTYKEYYYNLINSVSLYLLYSKPYTQESKKTYLKNVHSRSETVYKLKQNREIK